MVTVYEPKEKIREKVIHGLYRLDSDGLREIQAHIAKLAGERAQDEATRLWDEGIVSDESIEKAFKEYRKSKKT